MSINFDKNFYQKMNSYEDDGQFRNLAKSIYKEKINQKMQLKQIRALVKETVITAKKEHTAEEIKNLFDALRDEMGGGYHLLELSGHFDEGHFERVEEGWENLTYYPGQDILLKDDSKWYIKSNELKEAESKDDFIVNVDMSTFKKVYNIHWHAKFTHMDLKTGKTARFTKGQVSGDGRLNFVAKFLGLRYEPKDKVNRGQAVESIKAQHHTKRQEKYKGILEKKKMLKLENQKAEESRMSLNASRKNHKSDSERSHHILVENQALQNENKALCSEIEGLEYDIETMQAQAEEQKIKNETLSLNDSKQKALMEVLSKKIKEQGMQFDTEYNQPFEGLRSNM